MNHGPYPFAVSRYGIAVSAAASGLLLRYAFDPLFGNTNPYHTVWVAVLIAAWYGGLGPAILCTLLSEIGVWYWFVRPVDSFFRTREQVAGTAGFLLLSGLMIFLVELRRRAARKLEVKVEELRRSEDALQRMHEETEKRVDEKTSELRLANESLRELTGQLLRLQDQERRRIARELHDSIGQLLAAVNMNIESVSLESGKLSTAASVALQDNRLLLKQLISEIRTISHLLHPPLLDEAGLASALRWYVDGFSERSKIQTTIEIDPDLQRLAPDLERTLFRIVQESLTNVHRHSGSPTAVVRCRMQNDRVLLEVEDSGHGIGKDIRPGKRNPSGVGLRGMQERVRQLGGQLQIRSGLQGTQVVVSLPAQQAAAVTRDVA